MKQLLIGLTLCLLTGYSNATMVLNNGDFETGDLTGWTTTGLGSTGTCPQANRDWNVAAANSTGCRDVGSPPEGNFAAYNMFDGSGPLTYTLFQNVTVATNITSATLGWLEAAAWGFGGSARVFNVDILDQAGTTVLTNLSTESYSGAGSMSWSSVSLDVTSAFQSVEGQIVSLGFSIFVPATWTGAAGFGLDDISLDIQTASANVSAPATALLLLLGVFAVKARRKV